MSLRNTRLLQLLGLLVAVIGLVGFWLTRDVEKTALTESQKRLLGVTAAEEDAFRASFVVAGRDYDYTKAASPCRYVNGECIREQVGTRILGNRTDTIIYVNILGDDITMIAIPRDLYLPEWQTKINDIYYYQGAEGLAREVEELLDLPVDYYAIINIEIFKEVVDALGGVSVTIPEPGMYYHDAAAGLEIDFDPGLTHLNGEDAAKYVRFRHTVRGDFDRIDNVKRLAYAMLARLKELNVRAAFKAPELIEAVFSNIETNASPALVRKLIPHIPQLTIEAATIPTYEVEGANRLAVDVAEVEHFLAETFGGEARTFASAPELTLLITNRSGEEGLAERYAERLTAMGVPEERLLIREGSSDPSPTRVLTTTENWQEADYYTDLLQTSKQQVDRFSAVDGREVDLELILGEDAARSSLAESAPDASLAQLEPAGSKER